MKVKDLIKILSSYHSDTDIYVVYDRYEVQDPDICYFYQLDNDRHDAFNEKVYSKLKPFDLIFDAY